MSSNPAGGGLRELRERIGGILVWEAAVFRNGCEFCVEVI